MIRAQREISSRLMGPLVLFLAALLGIFSVINSTVLVYFIAVLVGIGLLYMLLILTPGKRWILWLSVICASAFGPLMDILLRQPVNWMIGLFVLILFAIDQFYWIGRRVVKRSNKTIGAFLPPLASVFLLYNIYFFLQALRPDGSIWNGMMAFRVAVIGLAAIFLTFNGFRWTMSQDQVVLRLRQFLLVFIITGLIVAIYGIFQFIVGYDQLVAWGLTDPSVQYLHNQRNLNSGTTIFRIFGTLRRNETMGVFMYLSIVAAVVGIRFRIQPKSLAYISLFFCLIAMLLTLSLTSSFLLVFWIFLVFITSFSLKTSLRVLGIGSTAFLFIMLANHLMGGIIQTRVAEHFLDTQEGIGRVKMAQNWITELSERPLVTGMLGTGICTGLDEGSFTRIQNVLNSLGISAQTSSVKCGWGLQVQDNWYATHSLEIGWLGLVIFWMIFFLLLISTIPKLVKRWQEPYRSGWKIMALGLLALWPSGFVGALIWYMPITAYFWSMMALVEVGSYTRAAQTEIAPKAVH
jgi:hypothetical protein